MTTNGARIPTAAQRVVGWRGRWVVRQDSQEYVFTAKRTALGFAASMARIDREVARRRAGG